MDSKTLSTLLMLSWKIAVSRNNSYSATQYTHGAIRLSKYRKLLKFWQSQTTFPANNLFLVLVDGIIPKKGFVTSPPEKVLCLLRLVIIWTHLDCLLGCSGRNTPEFRLLRLLALQVHERRGLDVQSKGCKH